MANWHDESKLSVTLQTVPNTPASKYDHFPTAMYYAMVRDTQHKQINRVRNANTKTISPS